MPDTLVTSSISSGGSQSSECLIKPLPVLCSGAQVSGGEYIATSAMYNIGRLRSIIANYNPTNTELAAYNFTPADARNHWVPTTYHISSGVVVSKTAGVIDSGGQATNAAVCAPRGYNPRDVEYTIVSWYDLVNSTCVGDMAIRADAGGSCTLTVYNTGSGGHGITSPDSIVTNFATIAAVTGAGASGRGGGGGGDEPEPEFDCCDVFVGQVVSAPASGYGSGTVRRVEFNEDGTWDATGEVVTVIFPRI